MKRAGYLKMKRYREKKFAGRALKPGPELERIINEAPEEGFFPLGYFAERMNFTPDELNGELRAGRLKTIVDKKTFVRMQRKDFQGRVDADAFAVTLKAVHDWLRHPETPPHLIEKIFTALGRKN